jgi:hypothetical protein
MQQKQRLNVELSTSGKKMRSLSAYGGVLPAAGLVSKIKVARVVFGV